MSSNIAYHEVSQAMAGAKRLSIVLEMIQVREITVEDNITANMNITLSKTFDDFYYYARVFHGDGVSKWKEMTTTHCPDIYDLYKPTAVLKLVENT